MEAYLWKNGVNIGKAEYVMIQGVRVLASRAGKVTKMIADAKKEGVNLTLASSWRLLDEQYKIRRQNVIDKTKKDDDTYLKTAPHTAFSPPTGRPGFSVHNYGMADDWNVMGLYESYRWLVKNAIKYGMVRTVPSERWHWEDLAGIDQFAYIPKGHFSWDGLA